MSVPRTISNVCSSRHFAHCLGKKRTFGNSPALWVGVIWLLYISSATTARIDEEVRQEGVGRTPCLAYENSTFSLACGFNWTYYYNEKDYILLKANEIFDGNDYGIDLNGLPPNSWDGLFKIDPSVEWSDAPIIKRLHMINGETSSRGGFLVQSYQNNFTVDSCSSSGRIGVEGTGREGGAGGICGHQCSGSIIIKDCWTTGAIRGLNAGGIAGSHFGSDGGRTIITNCWSEGGISGSNSGGISGFRLGANSGDVIISKSYSIGDMTGTNSGGICSGNAAVHNGHARISECYTLGKISGPNNGGITSWATGSNFGHVEITNCYTTGEITGTDSGGICGIETGRSNGVILIRNVYTLGEVGHSGAGSIIGHVNSEAREVKITMSVYNVGPMIGYDKGKIAISSRNSFDLNDISGKVYCYKDCPSFCWDTSTVWKASLPRGYPSLKNQVSTFPIIPAPSPTKKTTSKGHHRMIVLPVQCRQWPKLGASHLRRAKQ